MIKIIDVGSANGIHPRWENVDKEIISFDPNDNTIGLWDKKKSINFYITKDKTNSSCFKPNFNFLKNFPQLERWKIEKCKKIKVDRLDHLVKIADFLKIDTQGAELKILMGAKRLLKILAGIEIEVEFVELYHNQPLFYKIDEFLRKYGFELFDLNPVYWKTKKERPLAYPKGQLIYADALYLKRFDNFSRRIILEAYNYHDQKVFNFRGRRTLSRIFKNISNFLERPEFKGQWIYKKEF